MRADLDGDRDVRATRAFGVRVSGGGGDGVVSSDRSPVIVTPDELERGETTLQRCPQV